jgi:hypothetical protein
MEKVSYYLSDFWIFLRYVFNISDGINSLINAVCKSIVNIRETFKVERAAYYLVLFLFFLVMLFINNPKRNFYGGILLLVWLVLGLIPIYRSGEHRAWNRKKLGKLSHSEIIKLKEEKNGQNNLQQNERLPKRSNKTL